MRKDVEFRRMAKDLARVYHLRCSVKALSRGGLRATWTGAEGGAMIGWPPSDM
jgi:hypothetical protein